MLKKLLIALLVLVLLVAGAVFFVLRNLDDIVKQVVEKVGTELMGVPLTVESTKFELRGGAGEINGLNIANPEGYETPFAFNMTQLRLDLQPASLGKQPLVLDELIIDAPIVNVELLPDGSINLEEIVKNIEANTASADEAAQEHAPAPAPAEGTDAAPKEPQRIAIKKLLIRDVTFQVKEPSADKLRTGKLPTIDMSNLGGDKGAIPRELGTEIISTLTKQILAEAAMNEAKKQLDKAGKMLEEKAKKEAGRALEKLIK